MRIITTFNDSLFRASGRALLESVRQNLPGASVLVYEELDGTPIPEACVRVTGLPEFAAVASRNRDIIGQAGEVDPFNRRWFDWFRKVVAQYDAMVRRPYEGYTVFLDSDVRVLRPFDADLIRGSLRKPVGLFRGKRDSVESGVIFYDGANPLAGAFARELMDMFLSSRFRKLRFWADGYVMADCMDRLPASVHDLAAGKEPVTHTNSSGHTTSGQVLPLTGWGTYLEHDKGLHWRQGLVAPPA